MFEAITVQRRAGRDRMSPIRPGLLRGAIAMLNYIGQTKVAEGWERMAQDHRGQNAYLRHL